MGRGFTRKGIRVRCFMDGKENGMKIESSNVQMSSSRNYYSHLEAHSEQITVRSDEAATIKLSDASKTMVEQLREYKEEKAAEEKEKQKEGQAKQLAAMMKQMEETRKANAQPVTISTAEDYELQVLKRVLEMLKEMWEGKRSSNSVENDMKELTSEMTTGGAAPSNAACPKVGAAAPPAAEVVAKGGAKGARISLPSNTFTRITVQSAFYTEAEHTAYRATGAVKTTDGRTIGFNVDVEMSRAFCEKYDSMMMESFTVKDPLVFNLKGNADIISDKKFMFDIDSDGKEDEISLAAEGSGFLALDKNKDGKINDGSELFGTRSGDGFKDLEAYDSDKNGWIDENDDVFKDLVIWTKDDAGNNKMLSLKDADVGAIYLGRASTEYSLKNDDHKTDGVIRSTGVFLKESGGAGTVHQVDLSV